MTRTKMGGGGGGEGVVRMGDFVLKSQDFLILGVLKKKSEE